MSSRYKCEGPFDVANPGRLQFAGCRAAELFTRECQESLQGELEELFFYDGDDAGFAVVAQPGRPFEDSIFSRDMGVLLRELTHWGYMEHAGMLAGILMEISGKDENGFHTYPDHSVRGEVRPGEEVDGICAVIIGLILLQRRLDSAYPLASEIKAFLLDEASPLRYLIHKLGQHPLIPGSGEFGGGMGQEDLFYNAVQNRLAVLAMRSGARFAQENGDEDLTRQLEGCVHMLEANMKRYLLDEQGAWLWCIDGTLAPDWDVLNTEQNKGFGGINGVLAMTSDVDGLIIRDDELIAASRRTIEKLLEFPQRRDLLERYNMWAQFDRMHFGLITAPSYGQGYMIQNALLLDDLELASRLLAFLAEGTLQPVEGYEITRKSPYWFYERMFVPEITGKEPWDEGCGALNTVCIAEPLKAARMILGLDDTGDFPLLVPRLPKGWERVTAQDWPVLCKKRFTRANIDVARTSSGALTVCMQAEMPIEQLDIVNRALGTRQRFYNVTELKVQI